MPRKIVQICSAAWDAGGGYSRKMMLFALAEDGNVYSLTFDKEGDVNSGWSALPPLPALLSVEPQE